MKTTSSILCAIAALVSLTILPACGSKPAEKSTAQDTATLTNTYWGLSKLGDEVITTPQGARQVYFVMDSDNLRVAGFSGCNRMMGGYAINGKEIKFQQMAGTMMACPGTGMELEKKFLAIFPQVSSWEISGQTLRLLDNSGKTLATFQARPADKIGG